MKKSKFGKLNWKDISKGFIMAVGTSVAMSLASVLESGTFPNKQQIGVSLFAGLAAGITYLVKNILTNSNDKILKSEPE